jgi:hypothetical protein
LSPVFADPKANSPQFPGGCDIRRDAKAQATKNLRKGA